MSPVVIDLKSADDERDVVHRAVQALAEGQVIAIPTDTVYGLAAAALNAPAVERLFEIKGRSPDKPLALALKSADEALDYVPSPTPLALRLARRCWPGPVTLVFDDNHEDSVIKQLPPTVQRAVAPTGTVGLRVPAHRLVSGVLELSAGPLALTSANRSGGPDATTAEEVVAAFPSEVSLVIDGGKSHFSKPSSVVKVTSEGMKLLRAGVFTEETLRRLADVMVLFVCTGNTCRSPMAEALMKKRVAQRLGCQVEELAGRGAIIASAGISAMSGGTAAAEAEATVGALGLDLSRHESQPLTERLVRFADLIIAMTRGHRDAILGQWPAAAGRVHLLCKEGNDVSDPIGGSSELYDRCARQIDAALPDWLDALDLDALDRDERAQ